MDKEVIYREVLNFDETEFHLEYSSSEERLFVRDAGFDDKLILDLEGAKFFARELSKFIKKVESDK